MGFFVFTLNFYHILLYNSLWLVNFYSIGVFFRKGRTCLQCSGASPSLADKQTLSLVGGHTLEFECWPPEGEGVQISSRH